MVYKLSRSSHLKYPILFLMIVVLSIAPVSNFIKISAQDYSINWDKILEESQYILKENNRDILANFRYSIALANLGLILEAFEHFDLIKDTISLVEFNSTIKPYIFQLDNHPNDILLLNYAAFNSIINSNYRDSLTYFNKLIELEPENIWIRNLLAATYLELSDYENSKMEAKRALKIKENKYSHLILGISYYETGHYISSLLEFRYSDDLIKKIIEH